MATARRLIEFDRGAVDEVVAALGSLDDGSWVNIEPLVPDEDLDALRTRTPPALLRLFSGKGRAIPFGTIVAQKSELSVGLEHSRGGRVEAELRDLGIVVPPTWRRQQDHAKRGVVYSVPRDESADVLLQWILDAATALSGVPIRGTWTAMIAVPE